MKAILSDIHGNLEALQAVLADAAAYDIESSYCLGDTVGYGPNPRECVEIAMQWSVVLLGNMDLAAMLDPPDLGHTALAAKRSLIWARKELNAAIPDRESAARRHTFLAERPRVHRERDFVFVHGSPRDPLHEYIFPEDIHNSRKMKRIFASIDLHCISGHTHLPGVMVEGVGFSSPDDLKGHYQLDDRKTIVNVGSVGQPRDGDWRASYVLLDGDEVHFRRVEYDIQTTIRKIKDIDDLDDFLGDRLGDGQ